MNNATAEVWDVYEVINVGPNLVPDMLGRPNSRSVERWVASAPSLEGAISFTVNKTNEWRIRQRPPERGAEGT